MEDLIRNELGQLKAQVMALPLGRPEGREAALGLVRNYQLGSRGYAWIVDENGNVVEYSRSQPLYVQRALEGDRKEVVPWILENTISGLRRFRSTDDRLVTYGIIPGTGWIMAITLPLSETAPEVFSYRIISSFHDLLQSVWLLLYWTWPDMPTFFQRREPLRRQRLWGAKNCSSLRGLSTYGKKPLKIPWQTFRR